jgi:hypothetical protein
VTSSRLLSHSAGEVLVAYGVFYLQELLGSDVAALEGSDDSNAGPVVAAGNGGLQLQSAGNDHYPAVRLELWSAAPPRDAGAWEVTSDDEFTVSETGRVVATSPFGEESDATITLPALGAYQVRVHVQGQERARDIGEATFSHAIEQWLLQIWAR